MANQYQYFTFHGTDDEFGLIKYRKKDELILYVVSINSEKFKKQELNFLPEEVRFKDISLISYTIDNDHFDFLWVHKRRLSIFRSSIFLNGTVEQNKFTPNTAWGLGTPVPDYSSKIAGRQFLFKSSEKFTSGSPLSQVSEESIFHLGDTLWLVRELVRMPKKKPRRQIEVVYLNKRTLEYGFFHLPFEGKCFLDDNTLWAFRSNNMAYPYTYLKIRGYRLKELAKTSGTCSPFFASGEEKPAPKEIQFPYQYLNQYSWSNWHKAYKKEENITTKTLSVICDRLSKIGSKPFISFFKEEGKTHISLGAVQYAEKSLVNSEIPFWMPERIGKWAWLMNLTYDHAQKKFVSTPMPRKNLWERENQIRKHLREKGGSKIITSTVFRHPKGDMLAFFDDKTKEIVFKRIE
jgi:hypothetical protein